MTLHHVEIFTDGACLGNPGPGGWAALLRSGRNEKMLAGAHAETTNNRMEMLAAIQGLKQLKKRCRVDLYTDSKYLISGITEWLPGWKRNAWKNARKQAVKNADLWQKLDVLNAEHRVDWHWVKGHSGHPENERVDDEARRRAERKKAQLERDA